MKEGDEGNIVEEKNKGNQVRKKEWVMRRPDA